MQLSLVTELAWPVHQVGEQRVAVVAERDAVWRVLLAWGWLEPYPDDPVAWMRRALHADVGSAGVVHAAEPIARTCDVGWPLHLVEARVTVDDGVDAEVRIGAFYRFLEYGAVALIRAKSLAELDAVRPALMRVLDTARPAWQADGEVVCVRDLYATSHS